MTKYLRLCNKYEKEFVWFIVLKVQEYNQCYLSYCEGFPGPSVAGACARGRDNIMMRQKERMGGGVHMRTNLTLRKACFPKICCFFFLN